MRLLDLFTGTGSVAKIARTKGYTVTTLDLHNADINCDILEWDYQQYEPGYFDIIWASPPCNTFSAVRRCNIGQHGHTRESIENDMLTIGLPILRRTEQIIEYLKPQYFFIENPQTGHMKNYIDQSMNFYDVDYCKYSDWGYRKRTRIWTNRLDFEPRVCRKDCGYVENGKHLRQITGNKKGANNSGHGGGSNRDPRYRIPPALLDELIPDVEV